LRQQPLFNLSNSLKVQIVAVLGLSSSAFSQTVTEGTISLIRTGWDTESFAVVTAEPIINPANCSTPDGYITAAAFRGYRTYYDAVLTAFVTDVPITITVHNTQQTWPWSPLHELGLNLTGFFKGKNL
jgi:hypothetical protein